MSEENLTNPEQQGLEPSEQYEELSKSDAMAGVFTAPGETYETIANIPKKNYWLVPILICIVVGLITTFLFMRDAELVSSVMDKQKKEMMEKFEENIKSGKMTQEQADSAMESMDPAGIFFKIIGYGGAVIGSFVILFILSLAYLLILKIMKAQFDFSNVLNVVGLAMLIGAVGNLLAMVVSILKGDMSSLGLGLLFTEESVGEKLYALLSKIDIFSIWFYVVIGIGLSKIARMEFSKTVIIAFIPFVIYVIVSFILA
jgi:hypothetical protein